MAQEGDKVERRGLMFVMSSPSGAGKTTLSRMLLATDPAVELSISVTTRKKRPNEEHGRHYFFISEAEFHEMAQQGELLEYAKVFGNFYGTPKKAVEFALAQGRDVLFDIDWQGTQQLRETARGDLASVFVLPPSMKELERRLKTRAQDEPNVIAERMAKAADEVSHWAEYDYVIVNDSLETSLAEIQQILKVERLRRERQMWISGHIRRLQSEA